MAKSPSRVRDFKFPASHGFSGSAGQVPVKGHMRSPKEEPQRKAMGGAIDAPSVGDRSGYVSPIRSMAARKAARTRRSGGGMKNLVD